MKFNFGDKVVVKNSNSFYNKSEGVLLRMIRGPDVNSYVVRLKNGDHSIDVELNEYELQKYKRKFVRGPRP